MATSFKYESNKVTRLLQCCYFVIFSVLKWKNACIHFLNWSFYSFLWVFTAWRCAACGASSPAAVLFAAWHIGEIRWLNRYMRKGKVRILIPRCEVLKMSLLRRSMIWSVATTAHFLTWSFYSFRFSPFTAWHCMLKRQLSQAEKGALTLKLSEFSYFF